MGSVRISVEELKKATEAFKGEFSSSKLDDRIHRFPAGLRDVDDRYIVPMVVAIGPYHRASKHLRNTERVKRAAAFQFTKDWEGNGVYDAVVSVAGEARKLYAPDAVVGMGNHEFAEMMFLDSCFLLQYMDAYSRFTETEDSSVDQELRHFLFTNRACINNDIMLLENQLPWLVLQKVIDSLSSPHKNYMGVVKWFIQDMGNTFMIDADVKKDRSAVSNNNSSSPPRPPPPHLLGLLRRHKIGSTTLGEWPQVKRIGSFSATELAQIGMKLKASKTALFTDMDVRKRGPLCGELSMAPLFFDDTTACWLVNMAAFEVTTAETFQDDPNKTAVCSYLALLSIFMYREEDVHEMRSKRILHGHQTNEEMLTFFKGIIKLLPDTGCRFAHTMARIQKYTESRRKRTKAYQLVYNNRRFIIQATTIIFSLIGIVQGLLSLNQAK